MQIQPEQLIQEKKVNFIKLEASEKLYFLAYPLMGFLGIIAFGNCQSECKVFFKKISPTAITDDCCMRDYLSAVK